MQNAAKPTSASWQVFFFPARVNQCSSHDWKGVIIIYNNGESDASAFRRDLEFALRKEYELNLNYSKTQSDCFFLNWRGIAISSSLCLYY